MRSVIYRRNGEEESIAMCIAGKLAQKVDVSEMTQDQRVETMQLSIGWVNEGGRRRSYNAAKTPKAVKAKVIEDINLSKKVSEYAAQLSDFSKRKREARSKSRLEALNKMLQEEGR